VREWKIPTNKTRGRIAGKPGKYSTTTTMRRKLTIKAEDIDWSKTNLELERLHGVSLAYLSCHRSRLAPETVKIPASQRTDWAAVEWQQSNAMLVASLKVTGSTIKKKRKIHAPGTPCNRWEIVDWSLSTPAIMRLKNAARQVVYNNRLKYAPETICKRNKLPPNVDWSLTDTELTALHNVAPVTVARGRMKFENTKPTPRIPKSRWSEIDWSKPDKEIACELGVTIGAAYYQRRKFSHRLK
jgi:hypothetical protein